MEPPGKSKAGPRRGSRVEIETIEHVDARSCPQRREHAVLDAVRMRKRHDAEHSITDIEADRFDHVGGHRVKRAGAVRRTILAPAYLLSRMSKHTGRPRVRRGPSGSHFASRFADDGNVRGNQACIVRRDDCRGVNASPKACHFQGRRVLANEQCIAASGNDGGEGRDKAGAIAQVQNDRADRHARGAESSRTVRCRAQPAVRVGGRATSAWTYAGRSGSSRATRSMRSRSCICAGLPP